MHAHLRSVSDYHYESLFQLTPMRHDVQIKHLFKTLIQFSVNPRHLNGLSIQQSWDKSAFHRVFEKGCNSILCEYVCMCVCGVHMCVCNNKYMCGL